MAGGQTTPERQMAAPHYGALGGGVAEPPALDRVAWAEPTPALPHTHPDVLTAEQVRQWLERRFVVVDNIWPAELIAREAEQWRARFPQPSAEHSAGPKGATMSWESTAAGGA